MADDLENSYQKAVKKLEEMADLLKAGRKENFPPLKLQSKISPQFSRKDTSIWWKEQKNTSGKETFSR